MGWESFDVVIFDLGTLLQVRVQPNLKVLSIDPRGLQCETKL